MKKSIVLILFASVFVFSASTLFAQGTNSGGIGGRPAYPRENNKRTESIFVHTLDPGETVRDGVSVINNSGDEKLIDVYAADFVLSSDGAFACKQKIEPATEVGSWITLESNQVSVPTDKSQIIDFTIAVPETADAGEHNGCIVIQEAIDPSETDQGIGLSFRTAMRVAILVDGEQIKSLNIESVEAEVENEVIIKPTASNTGTVSIDAEVFTQLKTLWGATVSNTDGEFPVLRGELASWNFKHEKPFWGGWYKTTAQIDYDAAANTFLGDARQDKQTLLSSGPTVFVFPQTRALIIELSAFLLLVAFLVKIIKKSRQASKVKKTWQEHTVSSADTLQSLATKHNVSWKKLARANKIRAPYQIEKGQKIKVPPTNKE